MCHKPDFYSFVQSSMNDRRKVFNTFGAERFCTARASTEFVKKRLNPISAEVLQFDFTDCRNDMPVNVIPVTRIVERAAFEMSEKIRAGFLNKNPMPEDDTMERIHLSTQAQMIADEIVTAQIICI